MIKLNKKRDKRKEKEKLFRYCKRCGERYMPGGKFTKLCDECNYKWEERK